MVTLFFETELWKKSFEKSKIQAFFRGPPPPPDFGPSYFFTPWAKLKSKNGFGILSSSSTKLKDGVIYFEHFPPPAIIFVLPVGI